MIRPTAHNTWPPMANTTTDTRLLEKFSALVWAVARVSPMPIRVTRARAKKDPAPGPKKPS